MNLKKFIAPFVLFFALSLPVTAFAQEATPEPDAPVIVEVPDNSGNVVTVNLIAALAGLLSAFAAGGVVGVAGLTVLINRIKNDAVTLRAIEGLIMSSPPEVLQFIRDSGMVLRSGGELLERVSDGQPDIVSALSAPADRHG